jgi:cysteine desulfurase
VEHPAVLNVCKHLQEGGYQVTFLPVDREGMLDLGELERAVTDATVLVSVMYANNETGVVFPIEQIGRIAKSKGAIFHTDAVQAVGKLPIDLSTSTIDLLSMSGHKLHAPKGVGALYVRRGTRWSPFMLGGHQEHGRRGGTENIPYIVALGRACELAEKTSLADAQREQRMRDRLERALLSQIPNAIINGNTEHRLPNTLNISFEFVEGEAILILLSQQGIGASSGSACTSGSLEPSHVLRAMGVPFTFAHGSIRFSFSRYSADEDVDYIIETLVPIIERLRAISPYWRQKGAASTQSK